MSGGTKAPRNKPERGAGPRSNNGVRRRRILEAALGAFAHKGFDGATWRSIAEDAGVTQGLIRFYFKDKAGLWKAAFTLAHDRRIGDMPPRAVRDGQADPQDVAQWLRGFARHVANHPEEARMMVHDSRVRDGAATERLTWAAQIYIRADHAEFIEAVEELKAIGWFDGIPADDLLYMMSGAAQYRFLVPGERLAVAEEDTRDPAVIDRHVESLVRLFMAHAPKT